MGFIAALAGRAGTRRSLEGGFSLLELMVGLTILAIALVPVAYFYTKSLEQVEKASTRTRALMLARERITEIQQMPYEQIRTNVTPSPEQLKLYAAAGTIDPTDASDGDWYGYDFEMQPDSGAVPTRALKNSDNAPAWKAMFNYPLPLYYNPYVPGTQGYYNGNPANHYVPTNPVIGLADAHVNFYNAGSVDYEYEPIGFYMEKVRRTNESLIGDVDNNGTLDSTDIRMSDRRTLSLIEPSLNRGNDYFRMGTDQQLSNYAIYGRRTIIMDVLPNPIDNDYARNGGADDGYLSSDDRDGGASPQDPYTLSKGPDNKFQVASEYGTRGKLVTVQVFWLPRKAPEEYIPWDEMNKIELKTFIPAGNEGSNTPANAGGLGNNNDLFITAPN